MTNQDTKADVVDTEPEELPPGKTVLLGQAAELDAQSVTRIEKVDHIKRVRGGRGYLLSDNRVSGGERVEVATLTCCHCGCVVILNPERTRERGYCRKCYAYRCDRPGCVLECMPMSQVIELAGKHPNEQWLERGPNGERKFDERLLDKTKLY